MNRNRDAILERYFPDWTTWREDWPEWKRESEANGKTVVLIPARSGSTRVKNKNIRDLCGKPLLAYTTRIAAALEGVDRVVVSTDSRKYCRIAEQWGAEAPFLRPADFSGTMDNPIMSFYHMLCFMAYHRYPVRTVITMVPTNPFRNLAHVQDMVDRTRRFGICNTAFRTQTGGAEGLGQKDRILYKPLGMFSGRHVSNSLITGNQLVFITNPIEVVDVDTEEDLRVAQSVIENNLYDFGMAM